MEDPTSKTELLEAIRREHAKLKQAMVGLSEAQMQQPGIYADNDWTAKDILTHVVAWEQLQLRWMRQRHAGQPLDQPTATMWQNTAALNVDFHVQYRDYSVEQARVASDHSFAEIVAEVEATDEAELLDPAPYDATTDQPLIAHIAVNTYEHYAEHTATILAWREKEGF